MRKLTESNIKKAKGTTITYYNLFELLYGLESERPGIKERVWKWICGEDDEWKDAAQAPYNGRILNINLFYYGIGEEYPTKYLEKYPEELEHCKQIHPDAFVDGHIMELRKDLNLIISVYENEIIDIESFPIITTW